MTTTANVEYWLGDKQFNCDYCIACFENGKDTCRKCGFDMNQWNEVQDEEEDEEEEEENTCEICAKVSEEVGLSCGENGIEMKVCKQCDVDGEDYDGWGDKYTGGQECFYCEEFTPTEELVMKVGGVLCKPCYEKYEKH